MTPAIKNPTVRRTHRQRRVQVAAWSVPACDQGLLGRQAGWLLGQRYLDVLILTDVSSRAAGRSLGAALRQGGFRWVLAPVGESVGNTLLASRHCLTPLDPLVAAHPHRFPVAQVDVDGAPLVIAGLSADHPDPEAKAALQQELAAALSTVGCRRGCPPLVAAGSLGVIEQGHRPPHRSYLPTDYAFYQSLRQAGLLDVYRALNQDGSDHSWFDEAGRGHRTDHMLVSAAHLHRIAHCRYNHAPRLADLGDRAALVAAYELQAESERDQRPPCDSPDGAHRLRTAAS